MALKRTSVWWSLQLRSRGSSVRESKIGGRRRGNVGGEEEATCRRPRDQAGRFPVLDTPSVARTLVQHLQAAKGMLRDGRGRW